MNDRKLFLKVLYLVIILSSISCGDIFSNIKNITGNYYLVETDVQDIYTICYRTAGGDYTGRIPENVIEYAVVPDSLIVAKSFQNGSIYYYLIKTNQDSDYVHDEEYLIGPLNEMKFNSVYKNLQIKFTKVNSKLKYKETNNLEKDSLSNYDHYQFVNDTFIQDAYIKYFAPRQIKIFVKTKNKLSAHECEYAGMAMMSNLEGTAQGRDELHDNELYDVFEFFTTVYPFFTFDIEFDRGKRMTVLTKYDKTLCAVDCPLTSQGTLRRISLSKEVQFNVVIDSISSSDVNPISSNDSGFYEEHIFDTVGKKYSGDLTALLEILSYYKIKIPEFKYAYILKLHINAGGMYDNFILSNDKMPVFRASFNRNITPTQVTYFKFKNGEIDSSVYEFPGIGKLNKL